jgi:hypothetical protein
MGRRSSLTAAQWAEIERRNLTPPYESMRSLGKEFGISESAIRQRISTQAKEVKDVAKQLASAEISFAALPVSAQISARSLADDLKSISGNLASAARSGSSTAAHLSALAAEQAKQISAADPDISSSPQLRNVIVLHGAANEASKIATTLLSANRDAARAAFTEPPDVLPANPLPSVEVGDAMAVYQRMLNGG